MISSCTVFPVFLCFLKIIVNFLQGIVEPVQAFKRSGRGAIGAYGSERPGAKDLVSCLSCYCHQALKNESNRIAS